MFTEKAKLEKPICVNALTHMRNFHWERKLEGAVLAYIANFMSNKQTEERLFATFKEIDKNNDGILSEEELKEGFREYLGEDNIIFEQELKAIIQQADFNKNGQIEYSEFVAACTNMNLMMTEKNLKEAF